MNLILYIRKQIDWSLATFGCGPRDESLCNHIRKEVEEIEAHPKDLEEWIDVIVLAIDGAWRAGYSPDQIAAMLEYKQQKNFARKFILPDDPTQPCEHDRTQEEPS